MSGDWNQDNDFATAQRRANPDDPILRHIQARRIREHLVGAAGADPAQVARALDLAARAGVPFDVAERNLAQTQARAGADRYAEAMAGSPALGPWIARDPVNARIARHDYDNLGLSRSPISPCHVFRRRLPRWWPRSAAVPGVRWLYNYKENYILKR